MPWPQVFSKLVSENIAAQPTMQAAIEYKKRQQRQANAREFFSAALSRRANQIAAVQPALKQLGLSSLLTDKIYTSGINNIIGVACRDDLVDQVFSDLKAKQLGSTTSLVMRAAGSLGVKTVNHLVLPFWELPHRFSGFLFFNDDATRPEHFCHIPILINTRTYGLNEDNGFFYPEEFVDLLDKTNTVIATNRIALAARLQLRHKIETAEVLPLVAWHENFVIAGTPILRSARMWKQFFRHQVVIWEPTPSAETFINAMSSSALLSTWCDKDTTDEGLYALASDQRNIHQFVAKITESAKPWYEVLQDILIHSPREVSRALLSEVGSKRELGELLDSCPKQTRELAYSFLDNAHEIPALRFAKFDITEENNCWRARINTMPSTLVSDAVFSVDTLWHDASTDKYFCEGVIRYADINLDYVCDLDNIKNNAFNWLDSMLRQSQLGVLAYDPLFSKYIWQIALRQSQPQLRALRPVVGWDAEGAILVFPKFAIRNGGDIIEFDQPVISEAVAKTLPMPAPCSLEYLDLLLEPENVLLRRALCLIAAVILNKHLGFDKKPGIVLRGRYKNAVATDLCEIFDLSKTTCKSIAQLKALLTHPWQHDYPQWVCRTSQVHAQSFAKILTDSNYAYLTTVSKLTGLDKSYISDGQFVLHCNKPLVLPEQLVKATRTFLVDFMWFIAKKRFDISVVNDKPLNTIKKEMSQYLLEKYGEHKKLFANPCPNQHLLEKS